MRPNTTYMKYDAYVRLKKTMYISTCCEVFLALIYVYRSHDKIIVWMVGETIKS